MQPKVYNFGYFVIICTKNVNLYQFSVVEIANKGDF